MDKVKKYEKAIVSILNEYAKIKYANVEGHNQVVIDKENRQYLILSLGKYSSGPNKGQSVHDSPLHFAIINGKIWIQRNMTEWEVAEMLEEQGIKRAEIVLGFLSPKMREYSEYAVA